MFGAKCILLTIRALEICKGEIKLSLGVAGEDQMEEEA